MLYLRVIDFLSHSVTVLLEDVKAVGQLWQNDWHLVWLDDLLTQATWRPQLPLELICSEQRPEQNDK